MLSPDTPRLQGQGALSNQRLRFETLRRVPEPGQTPWQKADRRIATSPEIVRNILTRNQSPDIPFERSINPYRGCEHGCIYCYARPSHAYLGLSPGLDFERQIFIKENAPEVLRRELSHKRYRATPIALGANTDPYQPIENTARKTRAILEILLEHRHPVYIITKSNLILRDLDLLNELNRLRLVHVTISITSLNAEMSHRMEPRAAAPRQRLHTLEQLNRSGLTPGVLIAPVIPGLTDEELEPVLKASRKAGALQANYILLRLPHEVRALFLEWLHFHYPERATRVQHLIKHTRGGKLYDAAYKQRMRGSGQHASLLQKRFQLLARKLGFQNASVNLRTDLFKHNTRTSDQMSLFDDLSTQCPPRAKTEV